MNVRARILYLTLTFWEYWSWVGWKLVAPPERSIGAGQPWERINIFVVVVVIVVYHCQLVKVYLDLCQ